MDLQELKEELINTGDYTKEKVDQMDAYELFDKILTWNGIIGYTEDIISWIQPLITELALNHKNRKEP